PKIIHDAKPAMLAAASHGWQLDGLHRDTALQAYLARPDQRSYDLTDLALRYLHRELKVDAPDNGQLMLEGLGDASNELERNLMLRAAATLGPADALGTELARDGDASAQLLIDVEQPLIGVLARMEAAGIAADSDYLHELEVKFGAAVTEVVKKAHEAVGHEFNLGSPKQLQQIFFEELDLPKTKRIKTGYTTDADAIVWLIAQSDSPHGVLGHLLQHRDVSRLKTTVDGLIKSVSDDGRIHTTYNQTVAATGRLSSIDPNLQNIPIRTEEGRR